MANLLPMIKKILTHKFSKFLYGGALFYVIGLTLTYLLIEQAGLPYLLAYALIQLLIIVGNFLYSTIVVYRPAHTGWREILQYLLVLIGGSILNISLTQIATDNLHFYYLFSMIGSTGAVMIVKYFVYDHLVFQTNDQKVNFKFNFRYLEYTGLVLLFLVNLGLKLYTLRYHPVVFNADSVSYLFQARDLLAGSAQGLGTGWFGFGYSWLIALGNLFIQNQELAARLVNMLIASATIFPLYFLLRELWFPTKKIGNWIILIVFSVHPVLLWQAGMILSESSYIFWLAWATWSTIRLLKQITPWTVVGNALFWVAVYFTRPEGIIFAGLAWLFLLIYHLVQKSSWKSLGMALSLFIATFLLVIFPYLLHLKNITGQWTFSVKGKGNILIAQERQIVDQDSDMYGEVFERINGELNNEATALKIGTIGGVAYHEDSYPNLSLTKYFLEHPGENIARLVANLQKLLTGTLPRLLGSIWLIPFFLLGVIIAIIKKQPGSRLLVLLTLGQLFFFSLFFILDRYVIIILPWLYWFVWIGLSYLLSFFPWKKVHPLYYFSLAVAIMLATTTSQSITLAQQKLTKSLRGLTASNIVPYEKKEAGLWLREHYASPRIMERIPIVSYYANTPERILLPYTNDVNALLKYAEIQKTDFLVVDNREFLSTRPTLNFLLDPKQAPTSLVLIKRFGDETHYGFIYALHSLSPVENVNSR